MKIIQNAIRIKKTGEILVSTHCHDYQERIIDGKVFMLDGGKDYLRRSLMDKFDIESLTILDNTPFNEVKNRLIWGTRGVDGKSKLKYVKLKDCDLNHLKAILKTQSQISELYERVIKSLIEDLENEIYKK